MVRVLEIEGPLSNAEVMHFIKNKRAQHSREDIEDRTDGKEKDGRPSRFMKALEKHERHLNSESYPYGKNPNAYSEDEYLHTHRELSKLHMDRIQKPIFEEFMQKARAKLASGTELKSQMENEHEKKELTEPEWLMIANHAPTTTEMLHPMIEQCDERYTQEELAIIVQCIKETYRKDEFGYVDKNEGDH